MPTHSPAHDRQDDRSIPNDIVCHLPDDLARHVHEHKAMPEDVMFDENFLCAWGPERRFIHARATLPLTDLDLDHGVGFGLWVEVTPDDFSRFLDALEDDDLYKTLAFEGVLANHWPGFQGSLGLKVALRATEVGEKVHIEAVLAELDEMGMLSLFLDVSPEDAPTLRGYLHGKLPGQFFEST